MEAVKEKVKPKKQKKKIECRNSDSVQNSRIKSNLVLDNKVESDIGTSNEKFKNEQDLQKSSIEKFRDQDVLEENSICCDISKDLPKIENAFEESSQCQQNVISKCEENQEELKSKSVKSQAEVTSLENQNKSDVLNSNEDSNIKNNFYPELEVVPSDVIQIQDKVQASDKISVKVSDNRTMTKSVYPDLKSIEYCEKVEDITSIQTLVRTYTEEYMNKTCNEAIKRYNEFHMALTGVNNYPLFDLVREFQNAREKSTNAQNRLKYLNSKLNIGKSNLWKNVKKEVSSKGRCGDGYNVTISHFYHVKELDEEVFNEMVELLRELEKVVLSNAYYSYSDQVSKLKIEQYIYNMNFKDEIVKDREELPCSNDLMKIDILKKCISIIFHYQRQSTRDKAFMEICQKWLKSLVYLLLLNGTHADYSFVLNHVIRCPNGIKTWASEFIQLPVSSFCSKESIESFNCQCLYYALLVLYLILTPAPFNYKNQGCLSQVFVFALPLACQIYVALTYIQATWKLSRQELFELTTLLLDRDTFLKNVRAANSSMESSGDGMFTLLDSEGEEEENFEVVKNWSNDDIVSLLNQVPIARMYEHILLENKDGAMVIKHSTKETMLKIFAFSTALVNILFTGLGNYCSAEYSVAIECMCSMIRHVVCYVSDHWIYCLNLSIQSPSALQAEYDRFIFHVIFHFFKFQKLSVWKFLSTLPYNCTSRKMLWQILWIFHSPNSSEDEVYQTKDVDLKLEDSRMITVLIEKLNSVNQCDQMFLLNAYKSLVMSGSCEEGLLSFIVHEIFQVAFIETSLHHLSKESTLVLMSIIKKHPSLMTKLLIEVQSNEDDAINFSISIFEELSLLEWVPTKADIVLISDWLLSNSLSSPRNYLARILLAKMNWGFSETGDTVLPILLHQEIAILVLQAYMKFDNKANEWSVSNGLAQMLQFATLRSYSREDEGFVSWAWTLMFTLKLHALDRKHPPWVQIYDGFLAVDFLPDPFKEVWLQPLLNAYEARHPVACYLFLVMTTIGHNVKTLMTEGLKCLTALIEHQQYLAAIHSLYYILPFFVKSSEELLSQPQFICMISDLIIADMTVLSGIKGAVVGAVLHKIAAMIKHQVSQTSALTVECATPLLKLWISILLKLASVQKVKNYNLKDSAKQVHFLLDVILKISSLDSYTQNSMIDFLFCFGNPLLASSSQTSFWSKLLGANVECYTILKRQTFPDYPWLAWFVIRSETKQKHVQDLWFHVQKEMSKSEEISPIIALKRACSFLKISQPPLESLPIYRWGLQILETPVSHPVLPILYQQFFFYYFERISCSDSQMPKCLTMRFFKTGSNLLFLKKLQKQLQDAAEYYRNSIQKLNDSHNAVEGAGTVLSSDTDMKVVNKENVFNFELLKLFRAFNFWIDDKNLLSPNLCLTALDPKYCCERLRLILDRDQRDWFDFVSIQQLRDDLDQKVHAWQRKRSSLLNKIPCAEPQEQALCKKISKHINTSVAKPLANGVKVEPPVMEIDDCALSSWNTLVQLIENNQNIIIDKANSFSELASKLKQLNDNYKNWIPEEYFNEAYWETHTKTCHKGLNCGSPAIFKLKLKKYVTNQRIRERLESNRIDHHMVQKQLLNLPVSQLCSASIQIENYIRALSENLVTAKGEESIKLRNLGVALFYHEIQMVNEVISSVKSYAPSRNFFSTTIESLGNVFIRHQQTQLCNLARTILKFPEAGELAFDLFNPNIAPIDVFLDLYQVITSTVTSSSANAIFVLLNKIDLRYILKEKNANFCERQTLFRQICKSLLECGSHPPQELQMVHDVLRKHFQFTLEWSFPELYEDAVSFLLEGMDTNTLSTGIWYNTFYCFGCTTLNDKSSVSEIGNSLKKFAENLFLPPDQQMFVSSKPINTNEVKGTLDRLYFKYVEQRKTENIYKVYQLHVKPLGIFLALLSHSMLSLLNESDTRELLNISQLWNYLYRAFYSWLHPLKLETCLMFPWTDELANNARFMFQLFTICVTNFHERLLGYNCEKDILSYVWSSYVDVYVSSDFRHYSVSLCHSEYLNLPWEQFHPNSTDIEGMCNVLQSNLPESRDFLSQLSLKIPWIEVMKNISSTKSPEHVRSTLGTLGKLLIVSGLDISLTKSNVHQNNLKALEELSWHFLSLEDTEVLLELYYSIFDSNTLLSEELQSNPDVYILKFLKIVCCMTTVSNSLDKRDSNAKRLLYLRKYLTALSLCISTKNETFSKNPARFEKIFPSLFSDIENIISKVVHPDQQICAALPLVRETFAFLNNLAGTELENIVTISILTYLKTHPRSILLLPCLQTACHCLNQMTTAVIIMECCITTRFNIDLYEPADAHSIWKLILLNFQVPISMIDEFIHACVNKNAFLSLYCYVIDKIPRTSNEGKKLLLNSLIDWIQKCELKENEEPKCLLLWDKILELSINIAVEDNIQVVKRCLTSFCRSISIFGEDKSSDGFLGAVGFGRASNLSVNFRFLCRIIVAYLLLQMPSNASIRLEAMAPGYLPTIDFKKSAEASSVSNEPSPSPSALKAVENVKALLKNKPYSALLDLINRAVEFALDPKHCLIESREFLKEFSLFVFPKHAYLYVIAS